MLLTLAACGGGGRIIKPAPVIPQPEQPEPQPEARFALSITPTFQDSRVCRFVLEWNQVLAVATNEQGAGVPDEIVVDADGEGQLSEQELDLEHATEGEAAMSVLSFVLEYPEAGTYTAVATAYSAEEEHEATATVSVKEPSAIKPEDVFPPSILDPEDYEYDVGVYWYPEPGERVGIIEGFAKVYFRGAGLPFELGYVDVTDFQTFDFDEEADRIRQRGTYQCLIDLGFEPLDEFGWFGSVFFKLPHYLTFEEAYLALPDIFDDISSVEPDFFFDIC